MSTPPRKAAQISPATVPLPRLSTNRQEQSIFQIAIVTGILFGLAAISFLIAALQQPFLQSNFWQTITLFAVFTIATILSVLTATHVLVKSIIARTYMLLVVVQIALTFFSTLVSGMGIIVAFIALLYSIIIVSAVLTSGHSDVAIIIGIVGAIVISIMGTYPPVNQVVFSAVQIYVPTILGILVMVYIALLSMEFVTATLPIKLITGTLAITLIPMAFLALIENSFIQNSLLNADNQSLKMAASQSAAVIDDFISTNLYLINIDATSPIFATYLAYPEKQRSNAQVKADLNSTVATLINYRQQSNIISYGLLDSSGINIYDSDPKNIGAHESNEEYFQFSFRASENYVSNVEFSPSSGKVGVITFSSPIESSTGQIAGVLRIRYASTVFQHLLVSKIGLSGQHSYPMLVDDNLIRLTDTYNTNWNSTSIIPLAKDKVAELQLENRIPAGTAYQTGTDFVQLAKSIQDYQTSPTFNENLNAPKNSIKASGTVVRLSTEPWYLVYLHDMAPMTGALEDQNRISIFVAILLAGLVSLIATILARTLSNPIVHLTTTAEKIAQGNLDIQAKIESNDEIGTLSNTFNIMTAQLKSFINELEDRVRSRTKELAEQMDTLKYRTDQLQTVSDVARGIAAAQELEDLLERVTSLVSERFDFYHVGIFLVDEKGEYAILRAANSEGGKRMLARQHKLRIGQVGIVGYVTGHGVPRIATDVGADSVYFNNLDLPLTRSEMALPLKIGDQIIGALDVQSKKSNAFGSEDIDLFSTLADQVAIAIYNNRLYADTARALEEMQNLHRQYLNQEWNREISGQKYQSYIYTVRGLTVQEPVMTSEIKAAIETGQSVVNSTIGQDGKAEFTTMSVPINLRGETLGVIHLQDRAEESKEWSEEELSAVQTVADQIAQTIENARLFEQTLRRAERERKVLEITNKIRSTNDPQAMLKITIEELQRSLNASRAQVILEADRMQPYDHNNPIGGNGHHPQPPESTILSTFDQEDPQ
ncbi:MAG: GAF domain-containing protein [Anaerolineaceae bacterium]|nr:GAF domain-containing protein [Anaerolineaceae bacterium]